MQGQNNERTNRIKNSFDTMLRQREMEGRLAGKKEIIENHLNPIISSLDEHLKSTELNIRESYNSFLSAVGKNKENAQLFCQDKTSNELKMYLADRPVAYNSWKDADYDILVQLVMDVYE